MSTQPPRVGDSTNLLLKKLVTATEGISGGGGGAVDSVNGQTGVVVLTAASVGAASAFPAVSAAQTVYVSKGGADGAGRGTPDKPFLTTQAAAASIGDSSLTKPYNIIVGPGTFAGALTLPAFTNIRGAGGEGYYLIGGSPYSGLMATTALTGDVTCPAGYNVIADLVFSGTRIVNGGIDGDSVTTIVRCGTAFNSLLAPRATTGRVIVSDSIGAVINFGQGVVDVVGGFGSFEGLNNGTVTIKGFQSRLGLVVNAGTTVSVTQSSFASVNVSSAVALNIDYDCFPEGSLVIGSGSPTVNVTHLGSVPVQTQIVYVSKGGDDGTATGSLALPFLTVKAACDSIVDSSPTKAYVVTIGPGEYEEADFTVPVNVTLTSMSVATGTTTGSQSVSLKAASGPLTITIADLDDGKNWFRGIMFANSIISGGGGDGPIQEVWFYSCSGTLKLNATLQSVFFNYCYDINVTSLAIQAQAFYCLGGFSLINDAATADDAFWGIYHCMGLYQFDGTTGKDSYVEIKRSFTFSAISVSGDGLTLDIDKGFSASGTITVTGGSPTIDISDTLYQPTTPGDWAGTPPTTLEAAIDRLAAASAIPP